MARHDGPMIRWGRDTNRQRRMTRTGNDDLLTTDTRQQDKKKRLVDLFLLVCYQKLNLSFTSTVTTTITTTASTTITRDNYYSYSHYGKKSIHFLTSLQRHACVRKVCSITYVIQNHLQCIIATL